MVQEKEKGKYAEAGVDIDAGNKLVDLLKPIVSKTFKPGVITEIGGFAGLFSLNVQHVKNPVLVSSTDGVGTKLKIAFMLDKHDTVGIDLVAMCVNDIMVQGATPLFFLDYISMSKLDVNKAVDIVKGIALGCQEANCSLIGGETAELPGFYAEGEYDLAGFCVGIVNADKLIDGSEISVGDRIIGLASNGIHSNGFSLARKVLFERGKLTIDDKAPGLDNSIGTELLRPTKIYVKPILNLIKNFNIKGAAHITGGGFIDNIPRVLPNPCQAIITRGSWDIPPIFNVIKDRGNITEMEMLKVFNMGIGMMIVVSDRDLKEVLERLGGLGQQAYAIGVIEKRSTKQKAISFV